MTTCQARQYGDQMCCGKCGLTWDVNDPEPPECRKEGEGRRAYLAAVKAMGLLGVLSVAAFLYGSSICATD